MRGDKDLLTQQMFWEPNPELGLLLQDQASELTCLFDIEIRQFCQKPPFLKCQSKMSKSRDAITFTLNALFSLEHYPKTFVYGT